MLRTYPFLLLFSSAFYSIMAYFPYPYRIGLFDPFDSFNREDSIMHEWLYGELDPAPANVLLDQNSEHFSSDYKLTYQ